MAVKVYPGAVVYIDTPLFDHETEIYIVRVPDGQIMLIRCGRDFRIEYAFRDGKKIVFDDIDTAKCLIETLATATEIESLEDTVYYAEYDEVIMTYFYKQNLVFAITIDRVVLLGSPDQAPDFAKDFGLTKEVKRFFKDLDRFEKEVRQAT